MANPVEEALAALTTAARGATAASDEFCRAFYGLGPNDSIPEAANRFRQHQVELWVGHPVQRMN